ncbi:9406_t:CDS:1, partial [Acaulospora morrowiae]
MQKRQQHTQLSISAPSADTPSRRTHVIDPQTEPQTHGRPRAKAKQPNRTTKTSQKLTLFPEEQVTTVEEVNDDKYNQIGQLPQGTARIEAE